MRKFEALQRPLYLDYFKCFKSAFFKPKKDDNASDDESLVGDLLMRAKPDVGVNVNTEDTRKRHLIIDDQMFKKPR